MSNNFLEELPCFLLLMDVNYVDNNKWFKLVTELSGGRVNNGRPIKIGTTIRGYRLQKGLSQGDIEKRTGLLRCYLSRVENGHTVPSLDTLAKIAQALDIPLAQFFADDSLGREMNTAKLSDDELRFLTHIRRYSTNLNDSDRKLLLAMVKKFAATAVR
jgi:transcriptional regulator with XRE-family HTH domain